MDDEITNEQYHILHILEIMGGGLPGHIFEPAIFEPLLRDDYIWINMGGGYRLTDKGKYEVQRYRHVRQPVRYK